MATKKTKTTSSLSDLKQKYATLRVDIKAGREKNTNAHKSLKKKIAQLLTKQK
jgi:ribosomal protein L29